MYKIDLTEEEIRHLGESRYGRKRRKGSTIVFVLGLLAVLISALFYVGSMIGKIVFPLTCITWVGYTVYLGRKQIKAGREFLKEVKIAQSND